MTRPADRRAAAAAPMSLGERPSRQQAPARVGEIVRINETVLGRLEKKILAALCAAMPEWVTSDMLTAFGVAGAALALCGYAAAGEGSPLLWLAVLGVAINWFGDSLDGSLARFRKAERPKYGFFLDHVTDTLAMGLIACGIGLSSEVSMPCALAVLISYYGMVILSITTCMVTGVFRISFNGLGPTEIRLFIIGCTISAMYLPTRRFEIIGISASVYDLIALVVSLCIVMCGVLQATTTARELARLDPPRRSASRK